MCSVCVLFMFYFLVKKVITKHDDNIRTTLEMTEVTTTISYIIFSDVALALLSVVAVAPVVHNAVAVSDVAVTLIVYFALVDVLLLPTRTHTRTHTFNKNNNNAAPTSNLFSPTQLFED